MEVPLESHGNIGRLSSATSKRPKSSGSHSTTSSSIRDHSASSARNAQALEQLDEDVNEQRLFISFPEPFALSPGSPFHDSRYEETLPLCLKAKFKAYMVPDLQVQQTVIQCIARNTENLKREKQEREAKVQERLRWMQNAKEAGVYASGQGPHQAASRIKRLQKLKEDYTQQQVNRIVRGQTSALESIRIKELLFSDFNATMPLFSVNRNLQETLRVIADERAGSSFSAPQNVLNGANVSAPERHAAGESKITSRLSKVDKARLQRLVE